MSVDLLNSIRKMWDHCAWADRLLFDALNKASDAESAWTEYSHILGAEETWLSRLEKRPARAAIWPNLTRHETASLREAVVSGYASYLKTLEESALTQKIEYTNSAGRTFETSRADILVHVALHGQYHRGKINLLLRQSGAEPLAVDYIAFVRGIEAATTPVSR
jgi:uncharacterized damage-inducible protein DinB